MRSIRGAMRGAAIALALAVAAAGCDNTGLGTAPSGPGPVGIRFGTASGPTANVMGAFTPTDGIMATDTLSGDTASLTVTGNNGTLNITGIYLVVSRIQLEQADSACSTNTSGSDMECEDFKTPPLFISVPLDTSTALVVTTDVPAGTYVGLHLKVRNLMGYSEGEEHGSVTNAQLDSLLTSIKQQFADWPSEASMLVTGSFTPTGGTPQPFSDYFSADIEVERPLNPPLVVSDSNSTGTDLTVQLNPSRWFASHDSTVVDLSKDNYATTHQVVEFESEMEHGFGQIHEERHHEGD